MIIFRRKKQNSTYRGGIQVASGNLKGRVEHQNELGIFLKEDNRFFLILSEALTMRKSGALASLIVTDVFKHNFLKGYNIDKLVSRSSLEIEDMFRENIGNNLANPRFAAVIIENNILIWACVGSSAIMIYKDREIYHINDIYNSNYQQGEFKLSKDDCVVVCSKGLYDTFSEIELVSVLSSNISMSEKVKKIISNIELKNLKHQKNSTIMLISNLIAIKL